MVRYVSGMVSLLLPSIFYVLGVISRDELKAKLIFRFLRGVPVANVMRWSDDFCGKNWERLMRKNGVAEVAEQIRQGASVALCSASPELILAPFARRLDVSLIATKLEEHGGILSGAIVGKNCRKEEKVSRLEVHFGDLSRFYIRAWGDSDGDAQLLELAAEPFFRRFHKGNRIIKFI